MNLDFDIRRSIILSRYLEHWGLPESRKVIEHKEARIELYFFPGEDMDQVSRLASIGFSSCRFDSDLRCNSELLLVIPFDVSLNQTEAINIYLANIIGHLLDTRSSNIRAQDLIPASNFAPADWPKAVLLDEPSGEPDILRSFYIGTQQVHLSWLIPISESEYQLIKTQGIASFDDAVEAQGLQLLDPRREPCI